jgi:hypothetical protein
MSETPDVLTVADLAKWFPECGPCAFCGFHDKRHRLWDAILDDDTTTDEWCAWNWDVPVDAIRAVRIVRPYQDDPFFSEEPTDA